MTRKFQSDEDWAQLERRLCGGRDLDDWARANGVLIRRRGFSSGSVLLRIFLAYAGAGLSLRDTALWAASQGLAQVTDVAILGRMRQSADWLGEIAAALLAGRPPSGDGRRRLRIIDGSSIGAPGSERAPWRLHLAYDPGGHRFCDMELTGSDTGESLRGLAVDADDIVLADRGYARPEELASVRARQADFLVRIGTRSLRLLTDDGKPLNLAAVLDRSAGNGVVDMPVLVGCSKPTWSPLPARLVVRPMPAATVESSRRRARRAAQKEGYTPSDLTLAAAGHVLLLTTLSAPEWSAEAVASLYRLRWQVELAIKRLKSLGHIDRLPAKDKKLARAWIYANLIVALLAEDITREILDSPPSGPDGTAENSIHLAHA